MGWTKYRTYLEVDESEEFDGVNLMFVAFLESF